MSLSVAAWRDMILMIIQDRDYTAFKNQSAKVCRRGLNLKQRKEHAESAEEKFIEQCCEALEEGDIKAEAMLDAQQGQMFAPNKKAKHKVPDILSSSNPTQKRKHTDVKMNNGRKTNGKPNRKSQNSRKRPRFEISDSDDTDSDDDVYGNVPKHVEEQKLAADPPHIVLINALIQKCSGCNFKFTAPERCTDLKIWCLST